MQLELFHNCVVAMYSYLVRLLEPSNFTIMHGKGHCIEVETSCGFEVEPIGRRYNSSSKHDRKIVMFVAQILASVNLWSALPPLIFTSLFFSTFERWNPEGRVSDTDTIKTEYDFIIIGGGSSGAVVANRLTEISEWKVLLIEAGGDETIVSDIPATAFYLQRTNIDWQYKTVPQIGSCLAFNGNRCNWPRGKILGGSSVLNYMLYVRGNKRDYDDWEAMGNTGWSYSDVLPYFIKSEDNRNPYLAAHTDYHGTGGYLTVQEPPFSTPLLKAFIQGGQELGYDHRDCNGAQQTGFMKSQGTIRRGSRCSTAKAFLRPVRDRPNLHITMNSHVHKIMIDPISKQATGVRFEKEGKIYEVQAKKEVILSAGAVNSPQLLMLSGVGPAEHLASFDIPVMADLRVGDNLQDHISLGGMVFTFEKPFSIIDSRYFNIPSILNWTINGVGPLTSLGGVEGMAWVKTKYAPDGDWPDIQFMFVAGTPVSDHGTVVKANNGVRDDVWDEYYKPLEGRDTWQVIPKLLRPESRGTIRLASADPYTAPLIDPKYFDEEQDLKVLIEGTKIALALGKTEAFLLLGSQFYDKIFPGCEQHTPWTDDYWGCFIRHYSSTIYHASGSCKMGPVDDDAAVVDPQLKVYGIKGLRVIDCSIMPKIVSGNTNAPAIMIGEKGSDLIKADWPLGKQENATVSQSEEALTNRVEKLKIEERENFVSS